MLVTRFRNQHRQNPTLDKCSFWSLNNQKWFATVHAAGHQLQPTLQCSNTGRSISCWYESPPAAGADAAASAAVLRVSIGCWSVVATHNAHAQCPGCQVTEECQAELMMKPLPVYIYSWHIPAAQQDQLQTDSVADRMDGVITISLHQQTLHHDVVYCTSYTWCDAQQCSPIHYAKC